MIEVLSSTDDLKFIVDRDFNMKYLSPVNTFVQWKLESENRDDYNELFHATKLVSDLQGHPDIWFETHAILQGSSVTGVLLMVGGAISELENRYVIDDEERSLLLKYFHVVNKGQGHGSRWLNSIILPHYRHKMYRKIYVSSSHPASFSLYDRMGKKIAEYQQSSDNQMYLRRGQCFLIDL